MSGLYYEAPFQTDRVLRMSFEELWERLQQNLAVGTKVQHWSVFRGDLEGEFEITSVKRDSIQVSSTSQPVPKRDFRAVAEVWDNYCAGDVPRFEIRDLTRFSTYIISILHWQEQNASSGSLGQTKSPQEQRSPEPEVPTEAEEIGPRETIPAKEEFALGKWIAIVTFGLVWIGFGFIFLTSKGTKSELRYGPIAAEKEPSRSQPAFQGNFRSSTWGMTIAEMRASEPGPMIELTTAPPGMYALGGPEENVAGVMMIPGFSFVQGQLVRGTYFRSCGDLPLCLSERSELLRALNLLYGEGVEDSSGAVRWTTDRTGVALPQPRTISGHYGLRIFYESLYPDHQLALMKATSGGL